ncbi:MAG TPA: hypothetical protein DIU35_04875 [Candidatus Latescibacteria bacterium]|nr:hypothetical protein [Gemmatimonadota bacterium]HCR16798.1 hypothetical protein [Candidatus Latescibacterota bacterium]
MGLPGNLGTGLMATRIAYYGGATGGLKGHKFSLYKGGIRVPEIVNWPTVISAGQILDTPAASMDIFPTCLEAAGGDPSTFELDGRSLLPLTARGEMPGDRTLCWEMAMQNAIRRRKRMGNQGNGCRS